MEIYTSDSNSDSDSREQKTLNLSQRKLTVDSLDVNFNSIYSKETDYKAIETILLQHNKLLTIPLSIIRFHNLNTLDVSGNGLKKIPDIIFNLPLTTLIAKNNCLTDDSLPKSLLAKNGTSHIKEINFSGNFFKHFPNHLLDLKGLKYLYLNGNQITNITRDAWKLQSLQILSMGGNKLTDVPECVGELHNLQALILYDNLIENLPASIAKLKNLKSLLLHKNLLKYLPPDISTLRNLVELSLRDNPLVVRFVQDISLDPPTLMELAARVVRSEPNITYGTEDLPRSVIAYLNTAHSCVNPNCKGVFFDSRVEHIKFVDFCGKYRVPLLEYLCSSKCIEPERSEPQKLSASLMKKVLLG